VGELCFSVYSTAQHTVEQKAERAVKRMNGEVDGCGSKRMTSCSCAGLRSANKNPACGQCRFRLAEKEKRSCLFFASPHETVQKKVFEYLFYTPKE
jgi:hypothetical protein